MDEKSNVLVSVFLENDFRVSYDADKERFVISLDSGWLFISGPTMLELVREVHRLTNPKI